MRRLVTVADQWAHGARAHGRHDQPLRSRRSDARRSGVRADPQHHAAIPELVAPLAKVDEEPKGADDESATIPPAFPC